MKERLRKPLISLFILFHLAAVGLWISPAWPLRDALIPVVRPYICSTGLWQDWAMFAPNPLTINVTISAEVLFADGSLQTWKCPQMVELGFLRKYRKERYRKWTDHVRPDANSRLWPDVARWVARTHFKSGNPPRTVSLVRHWAEIPPPLPGDDQPIPRRYELTHRYTFFTYWVAPEDLR